MTERGLNRTKKVLPYAVLLGLSTMAVWGAVANRAVEQADDGPGPPLRSPALSPKDSLATIRAVDDVTVTLAASEPMVQAPVCAAFDEDGRLWVAEMRTYMRDVAATGELVPDNRIVILDDDNGDGAFDRSTVFADKLVLPRGVAPCFGGALVIEPPNLVFLKDTDGDGKADSKSVLLGGFGGRENPEHAGNGLLWGIDNWYEIAQHGVAIRFDGSRVDTRKTPAVGQWGLTRDDEGRVYYVPNSNALLADIYPKHFAAMNPHRKTTSGIGQLICEDSTTWPIHPTPGVNRGYLPGTLRKDQTLAKLTAACSPAFYRADGLGEGFRGSVFVCEPAGNLVKRLIVRNEAGVPKAVNAYQGTEFLASTDERFRPVGAVVGPDAALYVLDMYRGVIQHRTYMTPYLRGQVKDRELEEPVTSGRIYRVAKAGGAFAKKPLMGSASADDLVNILSHPDGWWRDSAQRLLVQRKELSAIPQLHKLVLSDAPASTRQGALWTLVALGGLDRPLSQDSLVVLMQDPVSDMRAAAAHVASTMELRPAAENALLKLLDDRDRRVRMMAACAVHSAKGSNALTAIAGYLRTFGGNAFERSAAVSGMSGLELPTLMELLRDSSWPQDDGQRGVLAELADCILRGSDAERAYLADFAGQRLRLEPAVQGRLLLDRFADLMRIDSENPRVVKLAREPRSLMDAQPVADSKLKKILAYLDWPGRPPVDRPRRARELTSVEQVQFSRGAQLFTLCVGCHQADGRGGAGLGAPLAGSARVHGRVDHLVRVLSHGLQGSYSINGTEYWGVMPPAPLANDEEFAAVLTYIRRSWDNTGDPVSGAQVGAIRSKLPKRTRTWSEEELDTLGK